LKAIKVDDETYKLLQELAEQHKLSIKEIASKAIKAYYTGMQYVPVDKEIKKIEDKLITLKYPARCKKCGRELKQGDIAYWIRYTYEDKSTKSRILCIECYNEEQIKDKELAKLILEKHKIKREIKVLKEKEKELLNKIEDIQFTYDIYELKNKLYSITEYLETLFENRNEIHSIKERIEELADKIKEMEDFARTFIVPKYIKAKKKNTVETYRYIRR